MHLIVPRTRGGRALCARLALIEQPSGLARRELGECTGSAPNGRLPLPNRRTERAWFRHLDPDSTALPWSAWHCLIVCQAPRPTRRCEPAFALGKDGGLATFKLVVGWHMANGATQTVPIIDHDKPVDRLASIFLEEGCRWSDTLPLQRLVPALNLAVALSIVRAGTYVGHTGLLDEVP